MESIDPRREARRLAALHKFRILDTPPDGAFERVTALAARVFDVPVSLVSLVDEDRIWFKSGHGIEIDEIDRDPGLCASVILSDDAYVVENAIEDPRPLANPLVAGEFGLRFYAAAPLVTSRGYRLGTVNILDFEPRSLTPTEKETLHELAGIVMDSMELRLSARLLVDQLCEHVEEHVERPADEKLVTICAWTKRVQVDQRWISFEEYIRERVGATVTHGIHPEIADQLREGVDEDDNSAQ